MFPIRWDFPFRRKDGAMSTIKDEIDAAGQSGGSTVTITPVLTEGTKIADFEIDGEGGSLYAPAGGSSGSVGYVDITLDPSASIASQSMSNPILLTVPSELVGKYIITANRLDGDSNIYVCGISRQSEPVASTDSIYVIAYNTSNASLALRKVRVWYYDD